jgi:hypothetical protein
MLLGAQYTYVREQTLEIYYRAELTESTARMPVKVQRSPDFQFIRNPGFNADRGPARLPGNSPAPRILKGNRD